MKSAIGKIVDWAMSLDVDRPSVGVFLYLGSSSTPTYAFGNVYWRSELTYMLGGTNAFSNVSGNYEVVSKESIITANPDVMISGGHGNLAKTETDTIKTDPVLKSVSAVENDRIYGAFDSCNTVFGITSQGFVNAVALIAMFMYEDQLNFEIDHYMGDDYADYLSQFWNQINS
jgi:ABC-type Fe3+-hydroxamate transport system substrate-binding protein